jgi:hypothetical protein
MFALQVACVCLWYKRTVQLGAHASSAKLYVCHLPVSASIWPGALLNLLCPCGTIARSSPRFPSTARRTGRTTLSFLFHLPLARATAGSRSRSCRHSSRGAYLVCVYLSDRCTVIPRCIPGMGPACFVIVSLLLCCRP